MKLPNNNTKHLSRPSKQVTQSKESKLRQSDIINIQNVAALTSPQDALSVNMKQNSILTIQENPIISNIITPLGSPSVMREQ